MNTYNDNLHNSVVASLNEQEISLQSITAKFKASQDTLYYRQGNRVTTYEELQLASNTLAYYQEAKEKTVECNNAAINLTGAATDSKTYIDNTVSNTATAASNVQIATNAITKLASDVGSIFSIVNAANFESEIYYLSLRTKERMAETAFNAEAVSDTSMDATAAVSNVPIGDLKKRTDEVSASLLDLQKAVDTEFTKSNEKVKAESAKLETATNAEKKATGETLVAQREYNSTALSYNITNLELNLNLNVINPAVDVAKQQGSFKVSFLDLQSPFADPSKSIDKDPSSYAKNSNYFPVDEYNVFVVKEKNKSTFSISNAEEIITQYPLAAEDDSDKQYDVRYTAITPDRSKYKGSDGVKLIIENMNVLLGKGSSASFQASEDSNPDALQLDTDGDPIDLGSQYVVFVMGVFSSRYKKNINNFDDYLSGASFTFKFQVDIKEVDSWTVGNKADGDDKGDQEDKKKLLLPFINFSADDSEVWSELDELDVSSEEVGGQPVHYRCIILPVFTRNVKNPLLANSMLTEVELSEMSIDSTQKDGDPVTSTSALKDALSRTGNLGVIMIDEEEKIIKNLEEEIRALELTNSKIDKKISDENRKITNKERTIKSLENKISKDKEKNDTVSLEKNEKALKDANSEIENSKKTITSLESDKSGNLELITKRQGEIESHKNAQKEWENDSNRLKNPLSDIGFLFNASIASKIPASNYTLATKAKPSNSAEADKESDTKYSVAIAPETTDNFGNRLIPGYTYVPAVLAVFDPGNINKTRFKMSLAISEQTFEYIESN